MAVVRWRTPCSTIVEAQSNAVANGIHTIRVAGGTYGQPLTLASGMDVTGGWKQDFSDFGVDEVTTILGTGTEPAVTINGVSNSSISGVSAQGVTRTSGSATGIVVTGGSTGVKIGDIDSPKTVVAGGQGPNATGILVDGGSLVTVENATVNSGTTTGAGSSAYGIRALGLSVVNVTLSEVTGQPGVAGVSAPGGTPAQAGSGSSGGRGGDSAGTDGPGGGGAYAGGKGGHGGGFYAAGGNGGNGAGPAGGAGGAGGCGSAFGCGGDGVAVGPVVPVLRVLRALQGAMLRSQVTCGPPRMASLEHPAHPAAVAVEVAAASPPARTVAVVAVVAVVATVAQPARSQAPPVADRSGCTRTAPASTCPRRRRPRPTAE
ncbi:MAG: hypothetical protein M5U19_11815 [Microthrixaceae bacterium]|nr:hypothetical protein [Microthrixaceae bacterium]